MFFFYANISNPNMDSARFTIFLHRLKERQNVPSCVIKTLVTFVTETFITQPVQFKSSLQY